MGKRERSHADDLRAVAKLAVFATTGVTDVVEDMHRTIASGPRVLGKPLERPARALTRIAYGAVRGVAGLVGTALDASLEQLAPVLGESAPGPEREAVLAALNGVFGDHLADTESPLAIPMSFRRDGAPLVPTANAKLLVLVHGSSMNDLQWNQKGHDHGAALAKTFDLAPIYVHYNTGRHVSTNGRELARLLEDLVSSWPVPVAEISILCHSMGGLVARSACHIAEAEGLSWRTKVKRLVCLGTPHHGSPLERGGSVLGAMLGVSRYSAPIGRLAKIRSAGVTDLRFGYVLDEHWADADRFALGGDTRTAVPLPKDVAVYAVAATVAKGPRARLPGDGLVPVASALGTHAEHDLAFTDQFIAYGTNHIGLLASPEVYEKLEAWFR